MLDSAFVWERVTGPLVQRPWDLDAVDLESGLQIPAVRGLVLRVEVKVLECERWAGGGITPLFLRVVMGELGGVVVREASRMLACDDAVSRVAFELRNEGTQAISPLDTILGGW